MDVDIPDDTNLDQFGEINVPDIASSDPEERKLARRIRIAKRVEALQRQKVKKKDEVEEKQPEKPTLLKIQLERSGNVLKRLFLECEEQVTNIRVANDMREVDRRDEEILKKEELYKQLEEDGELAKEMFHEISSKWHDIKRYNDPLAIHEELMSQKEKCDQLIQRKDDLIKMLRLEVNMSESKFYRDQQIQNDDISTLARRVEQQVTMMRNAHREELQAIEDVMIQERMNMMKNNDKRWEELYKKREQQELAISENKFTQKQEFEAKVTTVRTTHYENLREFKIRMERDYENLQKEFEYIKAVALANSEKMDYNYQILKKREDENIIIKSNQKRKLNKLRDIINMLRRKIDDYKLSTKREIDHLLLEINTLQKYIHGVRTKSQGLSKSNDMRYMQVWNLKTKEANELLQKLITIDKLLHEQQLGIKWKAPTVKMLVRELLPSYIRASHVIEAVNKIDNKFPKLDKVVASDEAMSIYKKMMASVIKKISDKSNFLLENKLRKILEPLKSADCELINVDNVFSGLGITTNEHVNLLFQFFKPYMKCTICTVMSKGGMTTSSSIFNLQPDFSEESEEVIEEEPIVDPLVPVRENARTVENILSGIVDRDKLGASRDAAAEDYIQKEGECLGPKIAEAEAVKMVVKVTSFDNPEETSEALKCTNHPMAIEPALIIKAIREFVTYAFCASKEGEKMIVEDKVTETVSRLLNDKDVKDYWKRYKLVLDDKRIALWDALYYGMKKYHSILQDRDKLNENLKCLRRQNMELKHLLGKYRRDDDREMAPPCSVQREVPITTLPQKINLCNRKNM